MSVVVVGVDGSPGSIAALRFALEEARLRRATLRVVNAWSPPPFDLSAPGALLPEILDAMRAAGEQTVEDALAEASDGALAGVDVERVVQEGAIAQTLVDNCGDATLLVVGSRGRGGFTGLLLGSVSQQVAQHAPCPVTIVHPPRD